MTRRCLLGMLLVSGLLVSTPSQAAEIPRTVVALYDPAVDKDIYYSDLHQKAEIWLNHLGLDVAYRSVDDPLPKEEELQGVRGILTWFTRWNAVPDPAAYCVWLKDQVARGRKVVILGEWGFLRYDNTQAPTQCRDFLKTLGVEDGGNATDDPLFIEIAQKDSAMTEFERPFNLTETVRYRLFRMKDPSAKVHLTMRRNDVDDSDAAMVWTSPKGGFAYVGAVQFYLPDLKKSQWRLNPFRFFEEAFGLKGLPRPDVTTINGRRIFYSQIDGDGIFNLSQMDQKTYAGVVIEREVLQKYSDLPFSIALIAGYLDMPVYQSDFIMNLYRSLLSLPNVEPAAHGYAHPLIWRKKTLALQIPGYSFDEGKEIEGSVSMVNVLLKKLGIPKTTNLYQWTGDCLLDETQIARADAHGLRSFNGGGGRFDKRYNSYGFLFPIGILRGSSRQIYSSFMNEDPYTNLWTGPYYGFQEVITSFHRTEDPIRLKPIDIYFHFYSGERLTALETLQKVLADAVSQQIFPVFPSEYVDMARDFFRVRMDAVPGSFHIADNGAVKTIRFDGESRGVDLGRSRGVLGFGRHQDSLYVFLDDASEHDIILASVKPSRPYLESAGFRVVNWAGDARRLTFSKRGWWKSDAVIGGMTPGASYRVVAAGLEGVARADAGGRLPVSFPKSEGAGPPVAVTIERKP